MATIQKRGNNYRIRVSIGYDTGKQHVESMTWRPSPGMTKKQIEKQLKQVADEFERSVKSGQYVLDYSNIKLADWCEEYLAMVRPPVLAPRTWESYEKEIMSRIIPALGHLKVREINSIHVQRFVLMLQEKGQYNDTRYAAWQKRAAKLKAAGKKVPPAPPKKEYLSAATIRRIVAILQAVLTEAVKKHIIDNNPADSDRLELPQVEEPEIQILDMEQAEKVLSALESEPLMYQVLIHLALITGCRRGELIALKWHDIDLDNNIIFIRHAAYKLAGEKQELKEPKRGSVRNIAIPNYLVDMLRTYRKEQIEYRLELGSQWHDNDFLFTKWNGEMMNISTPSHWWQKFLKRHNLPHVKFHALRHSSATLLLSSGENIKSVSARLGHKQLSTTNRYVHALHSADKAAAETFENLFGKSENARICK